MLEVGDFAYDTSAQSTVRVIECTVLWGIRSYRVMNPATGETYRASEDVLKPVAGSVHYDENYLRFVVELSRIKNEVASGTLTPLSHDVIPLPHQLHALNRALSNDNVRYLLADEVGLGKTIEAGLILEELKTRGLVRRTLVVCPTGLATQWADEMEGKFSEKFHLLIPSDFSAIRKVIDTDNVYGEFDQVITPMDSIKPLEERFGWSEERIEAYNDDRINAVINGNWDLVIIDEAHRVAGSSSDVARYKLGKLLSQASPYLLLLTATPHNGKTEPFLRLVRLLDRKAFPNEKSVVKSQVAPYLIRTEKREAIDNKGNPLFKNRVTHLVHISWDDRHTLQKELYERVSDYVAYTYNQAIRNRSKNMCLIFLLIIMQRMVTSSTAAVRQSLERRLAMLEGQDTQQRHMSETDISDADIEDGDDTATAAPSLDDDAEIAEVRDLIRLAKRAELQYQDAKVEVLFDTLDKVLAEDGQKAIVFTEFMATQAYLKRLLEQRGYSVSILNGSMGIDERNAVTEEFRTKTDVFVSTDAGGEGLNLQFANIVINYDMPWNPMRIEQRCGRVDRIGQTRDVVVYNFMIDDTVESRVHEVIEQKLSVILDELGVDKYSDVLDSEACDADFTQAYMGSLGKPRAAIERSAGRIEKEVREQVTNAKSYKEIIREDKDLGELVGKESDFDVSAALGRAASYYGAWRGEQPKVPLGLSFDSDDAEKLLHASVAQDRDADVLSIGIQDMPNEDGYFMLWELSIADDDRATRVIPVFVNSNMVLRPVAGKRIMDALLDSGTRLDVATASNVDAATWAQLESMSQDFAYNDFVELSERHEKTTKDNHEKYAYALRLRRDAARRVGIENIRVSKLAKLDAEERDMELSYAKERQVLPEFRCMLLARLVA